jgi:hypothetical protein
MPCAAARAMNVSEKCSTLVSVEPWRLMEIDG